MFDIVLYPVSAILWFWHTILSGPLAPDAGLTWSLAIVLLVCTIRALLLKPAISQVHAARRARELAPQLKKLRERYGRDRERFAREVQRLHAANGTSPFAGCLPALVQIPVFLALYWVLRGFTEGAAANQIFDRAGVESFLAADLFGAPLGSWISQDPSTIGVAAVLMVAAAAATFLTMHRQAAANPDQPAVMRALTYLAPAGLLVSGFFFPVPIAVLVYFLTSNIWTLVQHALLS